MLLRQSFVFIKREDDESAVSRLSEEPVSVNKAALGVALLGAGVLGNSLGSLAHGVLGQLSWQQQADGGLDFAGRDGRFAIVVGQSG